MKRLPYFPSCRRNCLAALLPPPSLVGPPATPSARAARKNPPGHPRLRACHKRRTSGLAPKGKGHSGPSRSNRGILRNPGRSGSSSSRARSPAGEKNSDSARGFSTCLRAFGYPCLPGCSTSQTRTSPERGQKFPDSACGGSICPSPFGTPGHTDPCARGARTMPGRKGGTPVSVGRPRRGPLAHGAPVHYGPRSRARGGLGCGRSVRPVAKYPGGGDPGIPRVAPLGATRGLAAGPRSPAKLCCGARRP